MIRIFLNLKKKSFDTVDHKILLKKLYVYGIRGAALKLLESFFLVYLNMLHMIISNLQHLVSHVVSLRDQY